MAEIDTKEGLSRRDFIAGVGGVGAGAILGGFLVKGFLVPDQVVAMPVSNGYLLVDTKKCAGCESCMLMCSLAHEGSSNVNLSRIQITLNALGKFPFDMEQNQCHQCPYPSCVEACPTGAMHIDTANGNVRMVDESKCIGCERCVSACPFTPSRALWNYEKKHAMKCDLCANTPFWNEEGGPSGKQICVETCPMKAISYTSTVPSQTKEGYVVNLRNSHWATINLTTD